MVEKAPVCPECGERMVDWPYLSETGAIVWKWHCKKCGYTMEEE